MLSANTTLRHTVWLLSGLALLFVIVWQAPALHVVEGLASYLPLHMFAETFSIVISMMVFGVAWNVYSKERPGNIVILSCALLAVGLIDFAHMLSFKGMPDFITPSSPEKAINLWLSARLITALALLTIALRPWLPLRYPHSRYWLLAGSLAASAILIWLGLAYPQSWPHTFIAGQGLTPFKIGAEYTIIAILLIPAVLFYQRARQPQPYDALGLFAASAITMLSELSFTLYSDVSDVFNLLGHLYKIVAYIFIYRTVFMGSVREPFQRLGNELAENKRIAQELHAASLYTRSLIEASLDPLVTISAEGKVTDVNKATENITGRGRSELIGTDFSDYFTEPDRAREGYQQVFLKGSVTDYPLAIRRKDGHITDVLYNASVYRNETGEVLGVFAAARDITERKKAEFVLRQSEEALKEAQRIARVGSWHVDLATNEVVWSEVLYDMYGFDPALPPPLYTESMKLFTPESWEKLSTSIAQITETGVPYELELEMIPKEGGRKWMLARGELVRDAHGAPVRVRGVVMDITVRKLDEQALHRLNRELRAISNCNQTLMRVDDEQSLLDNICRIICDDAGYRMAWVGYPENDAARTIRIASRAGIEAGYLDQTQLTWADTELGRGPCGVAIRSGKSISVQDFITDPTIVPWRDAALQRGYRSSISLPLKDENEKTFGILNIYAIQPNAFTAEEVRLLEELAGDMAFGIVVLRTRIERLQAEVALRDSEEKYRTLIQKIQAAVIVHGADTQILISNSAAQEMLGLTADQLLGKMAIDPAWHFFCEDGKAASVDEYPVNRVLTSRKALRNLVLGVHRPNQKSDAWLLVNADPVFGKDGEVMQVIVTFIDISERKRAESEIKELNLELEQRVAVRTADLEAVNKELEAFSYSVSHDLRTPLRAIDGFSHILLEDYADKLDDEGKRLLNVVRDNANRMGQLIDDILKFSRAGRSEISFTEIDMEKLAHEVFDELRPAIAGRGLEMDIGHIPFARGDRAMMHQVFANLLSNAIKFSRNREPARIEVGATTGIEETIYHVKDNGAGFDMQYADKLFGVFQRLHSMEEFEGTGIGLAIVKRIITRHGGRVWAEGKVNEGATVYFALPARVAGQG